MSNRMPIGPRGNQILKLLMKHGPLSSVTLRTVIEPPMCERVMNRAIKRLRDLRLVHRRHTSISSRALNYYELSQREDSKEVLKVALNTTDEELERVPGGTEAIEHWQECVVWAKHFSEAFPTAKIIHDFQMQRSAEIRGIFKLGEKAKMEAYPDLLALTKNGQAQATTVAIEIERTEKSAYRLLRKLRTLAIASEVGGVLYVCRNPRVAEKVCNIYRTRVLPRAYRVERYADQFLLISDGSIDPETGMIVATDLTGTRINLHSWMMKLRSHEEYSGKRN